jgi:hypothetical protein
VIFIGKNLSENWEENVSEKFSAEMEFRKIDPWIYESIYIAGATTCLVFPSTMTD